jgi:hypothetical protein
MQIGPAIVLKQDIKLNVEVSVGNLLSRTKSQLRQLPLILSKLGGGVLAVSGFAATVWTYTRKPAAETGELLLPLLLGCAGIAVFLLSGKSLDRNSAADSAEKISRGDRIRASLLSWGLFLLICLIFLICCWVLTR